MLSTSKEPRQKLQETQGMSSPPHVVALREKTHFFFFFFSGSLRSLLVCKKPYGLKYRIGSFFGV